MQSNILSVQPGHRFFYWTRPDWDLWALFVMPGVLAIEKGDEMVLLTRRCPVRNTRMTSNFVPIDSCVCVYVCVCVCVSLSLSLSLPLSLSPSTQAIFAAMVVDCYQREAVGAGREASAKSPDT